MKKGNYNELNGAYWIGRHTPLSNPMSLAVYTYSLSYSITDGAAAGVIFAARNKDNYVLAEIDHDRRTLSLYDICDNGWTNGSPARTLLGEFELFKTRKTNTLEFCVNDNEITIVHNGSRIAENAGILDFAGFTSPAKNRLMLIGFRQETGRVEYSDIAVTETERYRIPPAALAPLGEVRGNTLIVCGGGFELASVVPCVSVIRRFAAERKIKRARLLASARGFYNAYINGTRVGDMFYAPGFTDYRLRIMYRTYDITNLLREGENEIRAVLGSGYYSGYAGYNRFANVYGKETSFIARIIIEYENGGKTVIDTDKSWDAAIGGLMYADYLQGQYYDSRVSERAQKCDIIAPPGTPKPTNGELSGLKFSMDLQTTDGAREIARLCGKPVGERPSGRYVYDMGQNMVGTVAIKLRGKRGTHIRVRYGEMCLKTGELYVNNLRSAANTDVYVLSGDGTECFTPSLTAHGFRYVEIVPNGAEIESVEGIVISDISEVTGGFECSNELVNKLYKNIVWSQTGNFLLVPTDCPQRNERMGWTGDAQVFAKTAAYNMNVYGFMQKWLRDMREAQLMYNQGGAIPDIVPLCGDNRGGCAGWADAAVIVPWEMYTAYGKTEILEENYGMMKAWVEWQNSPENRQSGSYIQGNQRRGDHLTYDKSTPFILSATAYAAHSAELLSRAAKALGRDGDAARYGKLYEAIKRDFNREWVRADGTLAYTGEPSFPETNGKLYSADGAEHPSQTAYALAIDFGLIEITPRVREDFKLAVAERGMKLSTGFLGISHLVPALCKCGLNDTAFALLEQEGNPGWLYSVINGATTIWERWNSYIAETGEFGEVSMNSFNHYSYGAIGQWLFSDVLGISPAEPGYKRVNMRPLHGGSLTYAKGWHMTPHGMICAAWRIDGERFIYSVSVPDGVTADIMMPDGSRYEICGGALDIECRK